MKVLAVVGTRPNFMKTAPVVAELARRDGFEPTLIHTGQHYDRAMSELFLEELGLGAPDVMLGVGSGSIPRQTALVIERLEPVLRERRPDLVLVPGDVTSTLAASLVTAQLGLPLGHIEAGLRSFDRSMPEETNRVVADRLSDLLFTHSPEARENLLAEGRPEEAIHFVGNTMIDTLVAMRERIGAAAAPLAHGLDPGGYLLVTLHRPALVDGELLGETLERLEEAARELPVVFPVHPRTRTRIDAMGAGAGAVRLMEPLGYVEFMSLMAGAAGVLTDSGGIQEETTFLGIPCFTLRANTERPVTIEHGTNTLLGLEPDRILEVPGLIREWSAPAQGPPPHWDGHAAARLVDVLDRLS